MIWHAGNFFTWLPFKNPMSMSQFALQGGVLWGSIEKLSLNKEWWHGDLNKGQGKSTLESSLPSLKCFWRDPGYTLLSICAINNYEIQLNHIFCAVTCRFEPNMFFLFIISIKHDILKRIHSLECKLYSAVSENCHLTFSSSNDISEHMPLITTYIRRINWLNY